MKDNDRWKRAVATRKANQMAKLKANLAPLNSSPADVFELGNIYKNIIALKEAKKKLAKYPELQDPLSNLIERVKELFANEIKKL